MNEKRRRPTPGVRLVEVSVNWKLTVLTSVGYMPKKRPKKQNSEEKRSQLSFSFDFFTTRGAYHFTENSEIPDGR